jgi:hypothetical protein
MVALHFGTWFRAVFGQWQSWLSGGGIGGAVVIVVGLLNYFELWKMPKRWYAAIFIGFFFVGANYVAWLNAYGSLKGREVDLHNMEGVMASERARADTLQKKLDERGDEPAKRAHLITQAAPTVGFSVYPEAIVGTTKQRMEDELDKQKPSLLAVGTLRGRPRRLSFANALLKLFESKGWTVPTGIWGVESVPYELDKTGVLVIDFYQYDRNRPQVESVTAVLAAGHIRHTQIGTQWNQGVSWFQKAQSSEELGRFNGDRAIWVFVGPSDEVP